MRPSEIAERLRELAEDVASIEQAVATMHARDREARVLPAEGGVPAIPYSDRVARIESELEDLRDDLRRLAREIEHEPWPGAWPGDTHQRTGR